MARKKKLKRNISGLRNQPKQPPSLPSPLPTQTHGSNLDAELDVVPSRKRESDSMKTEVHAASDGGHIDTGLEERGDVDSGVEGSHANLMTSVGDHGDNPRDEDWVPRPSKRKAIKGKRGRPSSYKKGPDVGSKSERTIYRYRKLLSGQTNLGSFGFQAKPKTRKTMERANCVKIETDDSEYLPNQK
ncbi:hypothetical protein Agabi119p4_4547 [Agaricus bisporus var. burnettii]|uniref:Uncharacterized protein n=1 Tax=Agaricus bisporus var. burnettii TaxID=192524 RepID=A0A8H7F3S8_AGABI|nr:hypothetical protein Agabi119p4_4547 [Agaricus bisporus var. burnettii]